MISQPMVVRPLFWHACRQDMFLSQLVGWFRLCGRGYFISFHLLAGTKYIGRGYVIVVCTQNCCALICKTTFNHEKRVRGNFGNLGVTFIELNGMFSM